MATLSNNDYQQIRELIQTTPAARAVFKTWNLPRSQWTALFQAAENWFVGAFTAIPSTSFKAALDALVSTTASQARWIGKIWFMWRIGIDW